MSSQNLSISSHAKIVRDFDSHFKSLSRPVINFAEQFPDNDEHELIELLTVLNSRAIGDFDEAFDLTIGSVWRRMSAEQRKYCVLRVVGGCFHFHFGKYNALNTVIEYLVDGGGAEVIVLMTRNQSNFFEYWCAFMIEIGEGVIDDQACRALADIRKGLAAR